MVVEVEGKVPGFIVDSVSEVPGIDDPEIEGAPSVTGRTDAASIEGVTDLTDRILILLDPDALFGSASGGRLAA